MKSLIAAALGLLMTGPVLGQDLVADGQGVFKKYCRACHSVIDDDKTVLFKGGRIGPDLYNVFGRQAGTYPGFRYSKAMKAAGDGGLIWTPEVFDTYIAKPRDMVKGTTMAFSGLSKAEDIKALTAYLASVSPAYAADQ